MRCHEAIDIIAPQFDNSDLGQHERLPYMMISNETQYKKQLESILRNMAYGV
jgi:hypothetical protein